MNKTESRLRRARRIRAQIKRSGRARLTVHRTGKHMYAQIISADGARVLAAASTCQAELKADLANTSNVSAAAAVGAKIAQKALDAGINQVAFDRSGFKYHGRVKALADAARETGLEL